MLWIKYQVVQSTVGEEDVLVNKKIGYSEANIAIAEAEAYNGKYEVVEDGKSYNDEPLAIEFGGTGAKTAEQAREKLGAAPAIQLVTIVGTDLNDYKEDGEFMFRPDYTPLNIPEGINGWLSVKTGSSSGVFSVKQIWHRLGTPPNNDHRSFVRTYTDVTGWGNWVRYTTSKDFCGSLTDLGITEFPTTMKIVSEALPANGMLILDSRNIIAGGENEISDLGLDKNGVYVFMKGDTPSRFVLLRIYSTAQGTTASMDFGGYSATNDTVQWQSIDFAPTGYGLGTGGVFPSSLGLTGCSIARGGFYRWDSGSDDAPFSYGTMIVSPRSLDASSFQMAFCHAGNLQGTLVFRQYTNTNEYEWDFLNPPMLPGVEYRTTERWNGKPVYTKIIACGNGPNKTVKSVAHSTTIANVLKTFGACSNGANAGGINSVTTYLSVWADKNNVYISSPANQSSTKIDVQMFYTKS